MADIHIRIGGSGKDSALLINGMDIRNSVLAEGFSVEFPPSIGSKPIVTMRVLADNLNVFLDDADVTVISAGEAP